MVYVFLANGFEEIEAIGIISGLTKAAVFGFIIALSGCYFGIECSRSADSVGKSTTNAVVYGIVWMIVATGLITLVLQRLGI